MFQNANKFAIYGGQFTVIAGDEAIKIREWLKAPDCSANRVTAANKKTVGTGIWMLNHEEYKTWKYRPSILWIQGQAGSGKTVLT
ncbi:hypothetical protein GYMLUDRAFT_919638 [Collybiopsis luxurians FD-317 M1]|uniref:Nephrocystin 3-like N-terminal domain-containing protein n=1 Tax=Collybiopsis luxurians FD-317 M1 TaxID=944289 RepID=A0A0D0C828_9AGAR|nr:hypothetical protein GYMLUDRAFT_919638 [Collybiopsis luxurians FD-317 M1]